MPAHRAGMSNLAVPFSRHVAPFASPSPSSSTSLPSPSVPVPAVLARSPLSPPYDTPFDFPSSPAFTLPPLALHVDSAEGVTPRLHPPDDPDLGELPASIVTVLDDEPADPAPDWVLPMSCATHNHNPPPAPADHRHGPVDDGDDVYSFANIPPVLHQAVKDSPTLAVVDRSPPSEHVGDTLPAPSHRRQPSATTEAHPMSPLTPAQCSRAARTARRRGGPSTARPPRVAATATAAATAAKKEDDLIVPEPWADMDEIRNLVDVVGPVPVDVVDTLYRSVFKRAEANARAKKLQLREQLKKKTTEQRGTPAEISSRREAKVSRRYQIELRIAVEEQLRETIRQNALLWSGFKTFRASLDVVGQGDNSPNAKRQKMGE